MIHVAWAACCHWVTLHAHLCVCLAGTHNPAVPKSKRLLSNNQTNLLVSICQFPYDTLHKQYPGSAESCQYDQPARLDSGNLQVYITGHGGDGFMKFQDKEEVTSDEIGKAFAQVSTQPCFLCLTLLHCLRM